MDNIFFISDLHFNHTNIIKYCNRPFENTIEMNETIINNWNNTVSEEDMVYVLGDVGFFNPFIQEVANRFIGRLNGRKHLICGNHDRRKKPQWWVEAGFTEAVNHPIILEDRFVLSHEPVTNGTFAKYVNIHGHTHDKKIDSNSYINVCVECINYTPVSLQEIKKSIYD